MFPPSLRTGLLALVLIVALAGCSLPSSDGSGSDPDGAVTPVAVPGDDPAADGVGVNGTGVTDPARLAAAHVDTLDAPYVRDETWVMAAGDEELLRYEMRLVVDRTGVVEIRTANGTAADVLLTEYRNATTYEEYRFNTPLQSGVDRAVDGEETSLSWLEASESIELPVTTDDGRLLGEVFSFATDLPTDRPSGSTGGYRLEGSTTTPEDPLVAPWLGSPDDATASAFVTEDGFVCSLALQYDATYDGRLVTASYRVDYLRRSGEDGPTGSGTCPRPGAGTSDGPRTTDVQ